MVKAYERIFGSGPLLLALTIILLVAAVRLQHLVWLPLLPWSASICLGLAGLVLILGGVSLIWSLRTLPLTERGRRLVTEGPYQYVRHPLYSTMFLSLGLAAFFVTRTFWVLVAIGSLFALAHLLVRREEAFMERCFGEAWRTYARRTPRFFPRWRPRKRNDEAMGP